MNLTFERDSVCAADDVLAPNAALIPFPKNPLLSRVLSQDGPIARYLPCVHASRTFWAVKLGGEHVADITHTCEPSSITIRLCAPDRLLDGGTIHFSLVSQESLG